MEGYSPNTHHPCILLVHKNVLFVKLNRPLRYFGLFHNCTSFFTVSAFAFTFGAEWALEGFEIFKAGVWWMNLLFFQAPGSSVVVKDQDTSHSCGAACHFWANRKLELLGVCHTNISQRQSCSGGKSNLIS